MTSRLIQSTSIIFIITLSQVYATIPEEFQGVWRLNKPATMKYVQKSPKWTSKDVQQLPRMMSMLSRIALEISDKSLTQSMGSKKMSIDITLSSHDKNNAVFTGTVKERKITFTARLDTEGNLNLKNNKSDDFNYVVFKKGEITEDEKNLEKSVLATLMKNALKQALSSPKSNSSKAKQDLKQGFVVKYGKINIYSVLEDTISEINKLDEKLREEIHINSPCSQEDFAKIPNIIGIKRLKINRNSTLSHLEPIKDMIGLTSLEVRSLKLSKLSPVDLAPLSKLKNLETLSCFGTKVINTDALSDKPKLKKINFYMSSLNSIDFLRNCPNVEELDLYGNHFFKDYLPLLSLTNLKILNLYIHKQATDENLAVLEKLTNLEEIKLSNCRKFTTLSFLKNCENLKKIQASWSTSLKDISVIADLKHLQELSLMECSASDFSILKNKEKLTNINLSKTSFSDLSILENCKNLQVLDIYQTPIKDISPLKNFKNLFSASVPKTIPDSQIEALAKSSSRLRVRKR